MSFVIESGKLKEGIEITKEPIPEEVTEICAYSFLKSKTTIQKLTCKGTLLKCIKTRAFSDCIFLIEVDLSNCNLCTTIEVHAFSRCYELSILKLPSSIRTIGSNAFREGKINTTLDLTNIISESDSFLGNPMSFVAGESSNI